MVKKPSELLGRIVAIVVQTFEPEGANCSEATRGASVGRICAHTNTWDPCLGLGSHSGSSQAL